MIFGIVIVCMVVSMSIIIFIIINTNQPRNLEFCIEITSDEDFEKYNFPGSGSEQDPYRIENYSFSTTAYRAISIINVSKHFIVRNNVIRYAERGIFVSVGQSNITKIAHNNLTGGDFGSIGIQLKEVMGGYINDNLCNNNEYNGIMIEDSQFCVVYNNTVYSDDYGIFVRDSSNINVQNNTILAEPYEGGTLLRWYNIGIYLEFSPNCFVQFNSFQNAGLGLRYSYVVDYNSLTIENNSINGKELGFFINQHNKTLDIPLYNALILINCTNVEITNQIIDGDGIDLSYCANFSISNNTFSFNRIDGIYVGNCNNITLQNNTFYRNMDGLHISNSNNTLIKDCIFNYNYEGCYSGDSECVVLDCAFYENEIGYHSYNIYTSLQDLVNNSIFNLNYVGIHFENANCRIEYNKFYNNYYGCSIIGTGYSLLSNIFINNTQNIYYY